MGGSWIVSWGGEESLTEEEIWPDGDAPENPTVEDVMAKIAAEGSPRAFADNWNCGVEGVEVNGRTVIFR